MGEMYVWHGLAYRLIRSKRKTISIRILSNGETEIRAPMRASRKRIEEFLFEKREWVASHTEASRARYMHKEQLRNCAPLYLPFLGESLPVIEGSPSLQKDRFYLPNKPLQELMPVIEKLYKEAAVEYLPDRIAYWSPIAGSVPSKFSVGSAKGSWGSCNGSNALRFSLWLMAAPPDAIDAVVLHELCHIREHNHSKDFWRLVRGAMPSYVEAEVHLKETLRNLEAAGLR